MSRWERAGNWAALGLVAAGTVLVFVACQQKSYTNNNGGDDGGGDDGPCVCSVSLGGGAPYLIACGEVACVGATSFLCSSGLAIGQGECFVEGDTGPGFDSGFGGDGGNGCVPQCDGVSCGGPDMCGGVCGCSAGITCSTAGLCGNGCTLLAGSLCNDAGLGGPSMCCQQGNLCKSTDAGVSVCCAETTTSTSVGGLCSDNTDCCGYPAVTCDLGTDTCH
jgi:hypothetical protein